MSKFEISWSSLWRVFFMLILVVTLYFLRDVLLVLFLSLVISSTIDAPISFLERRKVPRILGALSIFFLAAAILSLLLYSIVPAAAAEFGSLINDLNKLDLPILRNFESSQLIQKIESSLENSDNFADILFSGSISFAEIVSKVFGGLVFVITALVLSFYLTISREGVEKFLRAVLPINQEDYAVELYLRTKKKLGLWLKGQLILSLAVGTSVFLGLSILGVGYSLILGILAAIFEIVPFVGPVFTGFLAFLMAVPKSLTLGVYVIILFVTIQQLESHFLIPAVMRRTVGIHPVVAVIALLAGANLAGFPGIILSIPTAVILQEIIEDRASRKEKSRLI